MSTRVGVQGLLPTCKERDGLLRMGVFAVGALFQIGLNGSQGGECGFVLHLPGFNAKFTGDGRTDCHGAPFLSNEVSFKRHFSQLECGSFKLDWEMCLHHCTPLVSSRLRSNPRYLQGVIEQA